MCHHPKAIRSIELDLLQHLIWIANELPPGRQRIVGDIIEHLWTIEPSQLTIPDLCRIASVSQRTLEYAFKETFGITPRTFLRYQRFHAVRRQLLVSRNGKKTVAQIAFDHGFYELGRFAGEYRRLFGELPSQTLTHEPIEVRADVVAAPVDRILSAPGRR